MTRIRLVPCLALLVLLAHGAAAQSWTSKLDLALRAQNVSLSLPFSVLPLPPPMQPIFDASAELALLDWRWGALRQGLGAGVQVQDGLFTDAQLGIGWAQLLHPVGSLPAGESASAAPMATRRNGRQVRDRWR